jgi:hypothetical protein
MSAVDALNALELKKNFCEREAQIMVGLWLFIDILQIFVPQSLMPIIFVGCFSRAGMMEH